MIWPPQMGLNAAFFVATRLPTCNAGFKQIPQKAQRLNDDGGGTPMWTRMMLSIRKLRKTWSKSRRRRAALRLVARFPRYAAAPKHGLPAPLIVSLTSYPARYPTLHLTIKSLLDQAIRPDRIILWIAHDDAESLPSEVTALQSSLFEIRLCEDIRSFKKIVPSLLEFPSSFIAICDDDTYYPDTWLKRLIEAYDPAHPTVVYYRSHRRTYRPDGSLAPYHDWQRSVTDDESLLPGTDIMPTGVGGVLYPPGSLPAQTTDVGLIKQLSATCDDTWLYFMWRSAGWKAKRVPGPKLRQISWPGTQDQSLWVFHLSGKKDEHLQAMSDYFAVR